MNIRGVRIQIAGSSATDADVSTLANCHSFISMLVCELAALGAGFVTSTGAEPLARTGMPVVFYWTVLTTLSGLKDSLADWPHSSRKRICVVTSGRGLSKIPASKRDVWQSLQDLSEFNVEAITPGWSFGGAIRARQSSIGDVLVALGGGSGVEHLARLYRAEGKPVIPIGVNIGGVTDYGRGGSLHLYEAALETPSRFFSVEDEAPGPGAQLQSLRIDGDIDVPQVVSGAITLIRSLVPPRAFLVRLLDEDSCWFSLVERYFTEVVEPVISELGYMPYQVGRDRPLTAFMDVEIFESIHQAAVVVVDLTDLRPNCMMELGYALGRDRCTVLSAARGTDLPFDSDKLETHFWDHSMESSERRKIYRQWVLRALDFPPLVQTQT